MIALLCCSFDSSTLRISAVSDLQSQAVPHRNEMTTLAPRALRTFDLLQHSSLCHQRLRRAPAISYALARYASTAPTKQPAYQPSKPSAKVNGPPSTLPAPLDVPEKRPDQSYFPSYLFAVGKTYVAFYKTGVWNIWANFKAAQPIQREIDDKHSSSLRAAVTAGALTRSDFQLLARNWHDIKRVPLFALLLMVCGEFTPLVVLAVSNVVPWTCRIPKQVDSDRRKLEERRAISFRNLTTTPPTEKGVEKLERMQLLHISWSLGLSSKMWDWLGGTLPGLPTFILRRKVGRRVEYLELDDKLLKAGGGVRGLENEEARMACVERGIDVSGRSDKQVKADLEAWVRSREKASIERLLLTR
jgi:hypothetical protein